jgi:hypothetical protein
LLSCTLLAVATTNAACVCQLTHALNQGLLGFLAKVLLQRLLQQCNLCNGLAPKLHAKMQNFEHFNCQQLCYTESLCVPMKNFCLLYRSAAPLHTQAAAAMASAADSSTQKQAQMASSCNTCLHRQTSPWPGTNLTHRHRVSIHLTTNTPKLCTPPPTQTTPNYSQQLSMVVQVCTQSRACTLQMPVTHLPASPLTHLQTAA